MSEELMISPNADKTQIYEELLPQLKALIEGENDLTANLANISAALKQAFNWWWVGFYMVRDEELVLGPFQGPVACTRIRHGRGVCGTAWKEARSILVPDVAAFPGHIACSSLSVSEVVVPVFGADHQVAGVIDVDSERYDVLDQTDVIYLEKISTFISLILK